MQAVQLVSSLGRDLASNEIQGWSSEVTHMHSFSK